MAYLSSVGLQFQRGKRNLSLTQIICQLSRESNLLDFLNKHFHLDFLSIPNSA